MFKRSKAQEKKGSEKREVLLVSFLKVVRFVFAIINAGIYIVNEYNNLGAMHSGRALSGAALYAKAYNHKIIPVFLTTLSTVLGLVPFLLDGKEEEFWFPFAVGTSGGLLFSIFALVFVMPIFMPCASRKTSPQQK